MSKRFPRIKNTKNITARGSSATVSDDGWVLLWGNDTASPTLPSSADTLSIVSTDAGDDTDDYVVIDYLDSNWQEKRVRFVPNGTSAVTTDEDSNTVSAIRVQRAVYFGDAANAGRVDIKIGSTVMASIPATSRTSHSLPYTVPVGQQAVCHSIGYACSEAVQFRLLEHVPGDVGWRIKHEWQAAGPGRIEFGYPMRLQAQDEDSAWHETKITYAIEAYAPDAGTDTDTEASAWMDIESTRTDTTSPGFRYSS